MSLLRMCVDDNLLLRMNWYIYWKRENMMSFTAKWKAGNYTQEWRLHSFILVLGVGMPYYQEGCKTLVSVKWKCSKITAKILSLLGWPSVTAILAVSDARASPMAGFLGDGSRDSRQWRWSLTWSPTVIFCSQTLDTVSDGQPDRQWRCALTRSWPVLSQPFLNWTLATVSDGHPDRQWRWSLTMKSKAWGIWNLNSSSKF